MTETIVRL